MECGGREKGRGERWEKEGEKVPVAHMFESVVVYDLQ